MKIRYDLKDIEAPVLLDVGTYLAVIDRIEYKTSKASNLPMFEIDWKIIEGQYMDKKVKFDIVSLSQKAAFRLDGFLDALRIQRTCGNCGHNFTKAATDEKGNLICPSCMQRSAVEYEAGDNPVGSAFMGKPVKIDVTQENDNQGKPRNRVDRYAPAE